MGKYVGLLSYVAEVVYSVVTSRIFSVDGSSVITSPAYMSLGDRVNVVLE